MKTFLRPRPVRVAYLVEENEHWQALFSAICAEAFARWGGRFTFVAPCVNGTIRPAYVPWLAAYDADIIYSYVHLDDATIDRLHERLGPAFLVKHDPPGKNPHDWHTWRPRLPISPLSVLSVTSAMARSGPLSEPGPVALVDSYLSTKPSQFLQESFGCYAQSLSPWPIARDISQYVRPVIFVPPEIQQDRRLVPRAEGEIVSSEAELIERIGKQRDLRGLAQISASFTPRLELQHGVWSRTVNLVVGDTFTDRLVFWNAHQLTPAWLDGGVVSMKVAKDDLDDAARFNAIVAIVKNRVHFPIASGASHAQIVVRSASLTSSELEGIAARLHSADKSNAYTSEHIASVDAPVPSASVLARGRYVEPGSPFQPRDWHEISYTAAAFRPPTVFPRHTVDVQVPTSAKQGVWQVDLDIEREVDYSWVQNVQHRWRLPRRLRMAGAFTRGYQLHSMSDICMPRATASGLLSLSCGFEGRLPEITVPTDEAAFRYAVCAERDWWPFSRDQEKPNPGLALDMRPSDKGRYLTAMLRIGGGIHRSAEIFLSEFWQKQFESVGATPKATDERIEAVTRRLRKRFKGGQIMTDDEWGRLASLVLAEARAERLPKRFLKFDELRSQFEAYREAYKAKQSSPTITEDWEEMEKRSLERSVRYLCQQELLHQGHEWRCQECLNNNWLSIDDMKRVMTCEVCGQRESARVSEPWHFKVNEFVVEGIREQGLLPVLWCLGKCAERANTSFLFLDPHELFFTQQSVSEGKPGAEMDLLIVADGAVRLVEAKASGRGVDVAQTVERAKRMRPDVVTLAVMEAKSAALTQKLSAVQQALAAVDIGADLMTLDAGDINDSPILPTGTSFRVRVF